MMQKYSQIICFALWICLTTCSDVTADPPNILLITMDNVGYGDLRSYNPDSPIKTPCLDRLAADGAKLTNFYTASPTCTVSRACLLTGRVAQRHRLVNQLPGVAGNYGVGLDQSEMLIPQYLKSADTPYATGCFGKWNIGFAPGSRPTERGFDEFIGHASGNIDYFRHNYRDRHDLYQGTEELHREGTYSTDLFADAAIDFVERLTKAGSTWFCYLPFNAPHFPSAGNRRDDEPNIWQAPDWALAEYGLTQEELDPHKRFYANVTALDRAIGRMLDTLDELGVADSTFVFCMSDNGAFQLGREGIDVGSNEPLRDGGVTCWEGGIRVPAFARWPGRIAPGTTITKICWSPDLLVTCAALARVTLPDRVAFDGQNTLPILTEGASTQHESLYFQFRTHAALRMGEWKIVREKPNQAWMLFNLSSDIGEQHDLSTLHPERVDQLAAEYVQWKQDIANSRPHRLRE
ncbi:MAG: sulfatase-like hydrolase/transferase [Planctomycetaceae bacterium]|nr:sulfatase-like hydrolase/transferase [Planctomycetaceae bacterium]